MNKELLGKLEILGGALPPNTLDELTDDLGGPEKVAEVNTRRCFDVIIVGALMILA